MLTRIELFCKFIFGNGMTKLEAGLLPFFTNDFSSVATSYHYVSYVYLQLSVAVAPRTVI
jgi:hypothetical protein